jgi:hypothetical protein
VTGRERLGKREQLPTLDANTTAGSEIRLSGEIELLEEQAVAIHPPTDPERPGSLVQPMPDPQGRIVQRGHWLARPSSSHCHQRCSG